MAMSAAYCTKRRLGNVRFLRRLWGAERTSISVDARFGSQGNVWVTNRLGNSMRGEVLVADMIVRSELGGNPAPLPTVQSRSYAVCAPRTVRLGLRPAIRFRRPAAMSAEVCRCRPILPSDRRATFGS